MPIQYTKQQKAVITISDNLLILESYCYGYYDIHVFSFTDSQQTRINFSTLGIYYYRTLAVNTGS